MNAGTLVLAAHRSQGIGAVLQQGLADKYSAELMTGMQFAQVRTNDDTDWSACPQGWVDKFVRVHSPMAGWTGWQIKALPLPSPNSGEGPLHRARRALRAAFELNHEIEALDKAATVLDDLIKNGEPVAKPFNVAGQERKPTAVSFGHVTADGKPRLKTAFVYLNVKQTVKDFGLWVDKHTSFTMQCALLTAEWNRSYFQIFEDKINQYLVHKLDAALRSFPL